MFRTPAGTPASCAASASTGESSTVSGLGFMTTVQPMAIAGASLNIASVCG
jgi:hypothetical protein